jgi:hypothetical protein
MISRRRLGKSLTAARDGTNSSGKVTGSNTRVSRRLSLATTSASSICRIIDLWHVDDRRLGKMSSMLLSANGKMTETSFCMKGEGKTERGRYKKLIDDGLGIRERLSKYSTKPCTELMKGTAALNEV